MSENQNIERRMFQVENELVEYKEKLTDSLEKEVAGSEIESRGKSRGKILELIRNDSKISVPEIAEIVGLSIKGVEKNIRQLKQEGIISRTSDTKSGEWIINI